MLRGVAGCPMLLAIPLTWPRRTPAQRVGALPAYYPHRISRAITLMADDRGCIATAQRAPLTPPTKRTITPAHPLSFLSG